MLRGDEAKRNSTLVSSKPAHQLDAGWKSPYNTATISARRSRHLCTNGGPIIQMLAPVVGDDRQEVNSVRGEIRDLDPIDIINQADHLLLTNANSTPRPPIAGAARAWLLRRISEAVNLAVRWCQEVERELKSRQGAGLVTRSDREFRDQVGATSASAFDALSDLSTKSNAMDVAAAARCATRSLQTGVGLPEYSVRSGDCRASSKISCRTEDERF